MASFAVSRSLRIGLGSVLLTLGLLGSPLISHSAHAQIGPCRDDPVVTLSNLTVIDLSASINDNVSDVRGIVYTVHAPAGTSVLSVVDPSSVSSLLGPNDVVKFHADDSPGRYDTYSVVSTGLKDISVSATMALSSPLSLFSLGSSTAYGFSGQSLHTTL